MDIIDELKKARVKKNTSLNNLIDKLYDELLRSIKFKNKNNITHMVYNVPPIFIGFPLYDTEEVTYKLSNFLKKKGFKTTVNGRDMYISW
jgi:hypothetical protein